MFDQVHVDWIWFALQFAKEKCLETLYLLSFPELFKRNVVILKFLKKKSKNHKLLLKHINSFNNLDRYISTGQTLSLLT